MPEGRPGWLARRGWLSALGRVLLFSLLVLGLFQIQLLLLAIFLDLPGQDRLAAALVLQGALLLAAALGAGFIMLRWVEGRPFRDLGLGLDRPLTRDLTAGVAVGAAGLVCSVLLLAAVGAFRYTAAPGSALDWVVVMTAALLFFVLPAAAEEAVFRGYPFRTLVRSIGPVGATLIMSALFALVHGWNPYVDAVGYLNIFAAGVMLSLAVLWTGSLWFASAVHVGWNWATAGPLDLPVSGLDLFDAPLYDGAAVGPAWITGGGFGPEGGLAGTLAVVVAIALLRWYTRSRPQDPEAGSPYVDDR